MNNFNNWSDKQVRVEEIKTFISNQLIVNGHSASWLKSLQIKFDADIIQVEFAHAYFFHWFKNCCKDFFEQELVKYLKNQNIKIRYVFKGHSLQPLAVSSPQSCQPGRLNKEVLPVSAANNDPFASFLANEKNSLLLYALKNFSTGISDQNSSLPQSDNFIITITGKSGTGKTHLLNALYEDLKNKGCRVARMQSLIFCTGLTSTPRTEPITIWLEHDFLLLDDLQAIADQPALHEILASCIDAGPGNAPETHGRKGLALFFTGTRSELGKMRGRLLSRLESGLLMELQEADLEVRLRFLENANKRDKIGLTREQIVFMARRCAKISEISGILHKIKLFCAHNARRPKLGELEKIMGIPPRDKMPDWHDIIAQVTQKLKLREDDVLGKKRNPDYVLGRQLAMYLCRHRLGLSYPELGRIFGGRDHSTVIHGVNRIASLLLTDKNLHMLVTELENDGFQR